MRKLLITSICLLAVSILYTGYVAYAQQVSAPDFTIRVTNDELNIISEGLQTQPFGKVAPLMNKLREQIIAQQPKLVEPPKPEQPKE